MGINLNWLTIQHWREPVVILEVEDPKWGKIQIQHWQQLHFRLAAAHPNPPDCRFWQANYQKFPKPMWFGWLKRNALFRADMAMLLRRFAVDHWNRFASSGIGLVAHVSGLTPHGTTELAERWSDLMPLLSWQLWLARR